MGFSLDQENEEIIDESQRELLKFPSKKKKIIIKKKKKGKFGGI
jgi:hypothetical protein